MCRHTEPTREHLPTTLRAPGAARTLVHRRGCRRHAEHLLPEAQLVVSELVTNAVRHGEPPVVLELDCVFGVGLVLRVSDGGSAPVRLPEPSPEHEGGRGLQLVAAVADRWGAEHPAVGGTTVWAALDPEAVERPF